MAISTIKISDTQEWAKRMSYGRRSNISNALEPALSSANMVMQTILGPPFTWWWNTEDVAFTCSPTLTTGAITNVSIAANVVTLNVTSNPFVIGQLVLPSALVTATFLNGQMLLILTASATQVTASFVHANYASAPDTGTLTATTVQDYTVAVPNFSHIDYASVYDVSQTPKKWFELKVQNDLSLDTTSARPRYINALREDASGNITFRMMPAPDQAYPVTVHTQKVAPLLSSLNSTWGPIPDFMEYVYNWGFLALIYMFADDPRVGFANQKFTAALLGRAEGLTEEERNIFLNNWNAFTGGAMMHQQGIQARGI